MAITGFVTVKGGKYYAVLNVHDEMGRRKPKWVPTDLPQRGNKRNAEKILQNLIDEWNNKEVPFCSMSLDEYLEQWIEQADAGIKPNTYRMYRANVMNHILPYFKEHRVMLTDLKPQHLEEFYRMKQSPGSNLCNNKPLSATTIKHFHQVLSKALTDAVRQGLINHNPASVARTPKAEKFMGNFLNPSELDELLALFIDSPVELPVNLCAVYGFRRSEVLGLKWDSVDFEERSITVSETLQQGVGGSCIDTPKTTSSYRTLPMTDSVRQMLLEHRQKQMRRQAVLKRGYVKSDYICTLGNGSVISPNYLSRTFHNVVAKSDLPNIRLHDLRHSAASNLLNMGFSIVEVQQWLGHGSASTTLNFYAHIDKSAKKNMADAMENALRNRVQADSRIEK